MLIERLTWAIVELTQRYDPTLEKVIHVLNEALGEAIKSNEKCRQQKKALIRTARVMG